MMRKILVAIVALYGLWACTDDDAAFGVMASQEGIRFEAVPGGAMMYYDLPDDRDVFAVL